MSQIEFLLAGRYRPHPDRLERGRERGGRRKRENNHSTHHSLKNILSNFSPCLSFHPPSLPLLLLLCSADLPAAFLSSPSTLLFSLHLYFTLSLCVSSSLSAATHVHRSFLAQLGFFSPLMICSPFARCSSFIFFVCVSSLPSTFFLLLPYTNNKSLPSPRPLLASISVPFSMHSHSSPTYPVT